MLTWCDKIRLSLLSTKISLLLLLIFSCSLIVKSQLSVCYANQQSTNQVSSSSIGMTRPEVYMPALLKPGMEDKLISLDFDQVDIKIFIKTIGELTGINFLIDDNIRGTVTLISPTQIRGRWGVNAQGGYVLLKTVWFPELTKSFFTLKTQFFIASDKVHGEKKRINRIIILEIKKARHGILNLSEYCWNWDEIFVL